MSTYAYADPPYPDQAAKHYGAEAAAAGRVAREVNHSLLIAHLVNDYPDGWALSTSTPALRYVLNLCPGDVRIGAWCKPFASFKPGVPIAYTWEPVIFYGGRSGRERTEATVRDHLILAPAIAENITLKRGVSGAKPARFTHWVLDVLGFLPGDELHDLFPGSGAVAAALAGYVGDHGQPGTLFEAAS